MQIRLKILVHLEKRKTFNSLICSSKLIGISKICYLFSCQMISVLFQIIHNGEVILEIPFNESVSIENMIMRKLPTVSNKNRYYQKMCVRVYQIYTKKYPKIDINRVVMEIPFKTSIFLEIIVMCNLSILSNKKV